MPTTWPYIFIRDAFGDTGTIPSGARTACHSPDIIPIGPTPLPNYQQTLLNTWSQDIGVNLTANQDNYLYIRGFNNGITPATGVFSLYYAPSSTLLTPSIWANNKILGNNGNPVNVLQTSPGIIAIPDQAFKWASVPAPPPNQHYCLIGIYTDGTVVPNPIPSTPFTTPDAFVTWVLNSPNVAWRNIGLVNGNVAMRTDQTNIANNDTTNPRQYMFYAQCYNMPVGTTLQLTCQSAGPSPVIAANGTVVQYVNPSTLACMSTLPANSGPYPLQLIATAPSGQVLTGAQVFFQQFLIEDELTADEIRPHMQLFPREVQENLGLDGTVTGVLVGEVEVNYSDSAGNFGKSLRAEGMFA